mmetsp:Transcript_2595/g.11365  ORF Transcript_2595/g.11365 Transcript_2595/m.11365 type:complete len:201 (+) Transcript_2595:1475-2077(+)
MLYGLGSGKIVRATVSGCSSFKLEYTAFGQCLRQNKSSSIHLPTRWVCFVCLLHFIASQTSCFRIRIISTSVDVRVHLLTAFGDRRGWRRGVQADEFTRSRYQMFLFLHTLNLDWITLTHINHFLVRTLPNGRRASRRFCVVSLVALSFLRFFPPIPYPHVLRFISEVLFSDLHRKLCRIRRGSSIRVPCSRVERVSVVR